MKSTSSSSFTHRDSCEQSLRNVGNDDSYKENYSLQPSVFKDQREDEEADTQEHSHSSDEVDEVLNLHGNGSLSPFQSRCQTGNTAHHSAVPSPNNNATGSA